MEKKTASAIMLTLLLTSMLTLAFNTQPVKAAGTIYIRADGSVDPPTAPIQRDGNIYTFTDNINDSIVIERNDIVIDGAGYTLQGSGSGNGFYWSGINNVTIKNTNIKNFPTGIYLGSYSNYNSISGNNITNNGYYGVLLSDSSNNSVYENNITNNDYGILLSGSSNNILRSNSMANNQYNLVVWGVNLSHFVNDIDVSNTVDGKPVYYLINKENLVIDPSTHPNIGYLALVNSTNITVKGLELKNNFEGILFAYTKNSQITNNNVTNAHYGIYLHGSSGNILSSNNIIASYYGLGIMLDSSSYNSFSNNTIRGGDYGVYLYSSSNYNIFLGNDIISSRFYGTGVYLDDSSNHNIFSSNNIGMSAFGHYFINGVMLSESFNNSFSDTTIYTGAFGIGVSLWSSSVNNFSGNDIRGFRGVALSTSSYNIFSGNTMRSSYYGVQLGSSSYNIFSGNTLSYNVGFGGALGNGTNLSNSHYNVISWNSIKNNKGVGVSLVSSSSNKIFSNNIANNLYGVLLSGSSNNIIYHNNFTDNSQQFSVYPSGYANVWDDGYPSGGNYWSDYTDVDFNHGPYQNETGSDGIWDHPYVIDANNQDRYPLINPWTSTPNQLPVALFDYYPVEPKAGEQVTFDASSSYDSDGRIVSYEWDWDGDGDFDDYGGSSIMTFWWTEEGTYTVTLRVVDDKGEVCLMSKDITITTSGWGRANIILAGRFDWVHQWWWENHGDFKRIDSWIRKFSTGSKPLDWLKGTKFSWCEEADIVYVLNKEMDASQAPGFTYKIYALNAIEEEELVHEAWTQSTPQYNYVMKPLFKYAFGSVWSISISEQAIINLNLGLGIGVSTVRTACKALTLKSVFDDIQTESYSIALATYFRYRWNDPPEEAWALTEPSARLSLPLSATEEEKIAILENEKWYFEQLWLEYDGEHNYDPFSRQGIPQELREQYREQLKSLLLSALEKYANELPSRKRAQIASPVELRVYDSEGRVTGVINGEEKEELPNSVYVNETKTAIIFLPSNSLSYKVVGTGAGIYGLGITSIEDGQIVNFTATDIPTSITAIHQYTINWTALLQGEKGVTIEVDSDGDGTFEYAFTSDSELNRTEYVIATTKYDIGITEINPSKSVTGQGYNLSINTTIMNYGAYTEIFNVTIYVNTTLVASQTVTLASGNSTTLTFTWNTTGFAYGNYTISVVADTVLGETYIGDNTYLAAFPVRVGVPGDVTGFGGTVDGTCDMRDIGAICGKFMTPPSGPDWDPNMDINGDGGVDMRDIGIACDNYLKTEE